MKLRAKQDTAINSQLGLRTIKGPMISDKEEVLEPGEVLDVPDDFVVNENVFDVVEQLRTPPGAAPQYETLQRGDPRLSRVQWVEFDDDGMPKPPPKKTKKPAPEKPAGATT